jgi:periplasmic protein TonB
MQASWIELGEFTLPPAVPEAVTDSDPLDIATLEPEPEPNRNPNQSQNPSQSRNPSRNLSPSRNPGRNRHLVPSRGRSRRFRPQSGRARGDRSGRAEGGRRAGAGTLLEEARGEPFEEPGFGAAYLNNPPPEYPRISQRRREQGTVLLWVSVAADGRPVNWRVERSSGFERLDNAALEAAAGWRFEPARRGNRPVAASVLVPMEFRLQ